MQIEIIPQIELGNVSRLRIGDHLNKAISDATCERFRFAVAYMRLSGLDRLGAAIDGLLNRGGHVSGAVGIDEEITSIEALTLLSEISSDSTIFHTVSDFIYHPKLYLMSSEKQAVAVIGSANLTGDGLFRNVEFATAIHLDFGITADYLAYKQYDSFIDELLNITHPNIQAVNESTIKMLANNGMIKSETQTKEPGTSIRPKRKPGKSTDVAQLFPPISIPVAPPRRKLARSKAVSQPSVVAPPPMIGIAETFLMQLSSFDSSHRSGVSGTAEVLIPQAAIDFFPPLSLGKKYLETFFDVVLNTNMGRERHGYRFWSYKNRTEWRLRMDHQTIDLSTPGGGDLLIINKLATKPDGDLLYEVTILPQTDPTFQVFLSMCTNEAHGKRWGMIDI